MSNVFSLLLAREARLLFRRPAELANPLVFFAIVIAKQLYGGLGQNPFNPAMVGYVVLLISFPVQMTSWLPPDELRATALSLHDTLLAIFSGHTSQGATLHELQMGVDGISQATPLDGFKTGLRSGHSVEQVLQQPLFGWGRWSASHWLAYG